MIAEPPLAKHLPVRSGLAMLSLMAKRRCTCESCTDIGIDQLYTSAQMGAVMGGISLTSLASEGNTDHARSQHAEAEVLLVGTVE